MLILLGLMLIFDAGIFVLVYCFLINQRDATFELQYIHHAARIIMATGTSNAQVLGDLRGITNAITAKLTDIQTAQQLLQTAILRLEKELQENANAGPSISPTAVAEVNDQLRAALDAMNSVTATIGAQAAAVGKDADDEDANGPVVDQNPAPEPLPEPDPEPEIPVAPVVTISPNGATLVAGETQQFTASVSGASDSGVTWRVAESGAGGSVDENGLYTAAGSGTDLVIVTSVADDSARALATVVIG